MKIIWCYNIFLSLKILIMSTDNFHQYAILIMTSFLLFWSLSFASASRIERTCIWISCCNQDDWTLSHFQKNQTGDVNARKTMHFIEECANITVIQFRQHGSSFSMFLFFLPWYVGCSNNHKTKKQKTKENKTKSQKPHIKQC